jgi:hypothetical protein
MGNSRLEHKRGLVVNPLIKGLPVAFIILSLDAPPAKILTVNWLAVTR